MTPASTRVSVRTNVNGRDHEIVVDARRTLAEVVREELALTGTHLGCEQGACGACTVLLDGVSARACLTLAARADGRRVVTIEGLGDGPLAASLRQACLDHFAFQCGFCTPGMLIAATELLTENADPSVAEVREALSGNLCRCTGYDSIVAAVMAAAEALRS